MSGGPNVLSPGYVSIDVAVAIRDEWRTGGSDVVLTNGCFDLLHVGHVRYLEAARALGDRLIVAVDDDASVRRLKGSGRPLVPLDDRASVLAALRCVDMVVGFDGPGAAAVVRELRPDIYVKGGDYSADRHRPPEADVAEAGGGRVVFVAFEEGHSTSAIVARVRGE